MAKRRNELKTNELFHEFYPSSDVRMTPYSPNLVGKRVGRLSRSGEDTNGVCRSGGAHLAVVKNRCSYGRHLCMRRGWMECVDDTGGTESDRCGGSCKRREKCASLHLKEEQTREAGSRSRARFCRHLFYRPLRTLLPPPLLYDRDNRQKIETPPKVHPCYSIVKALIAVRHLIPFSLDTG